MKLNHPGVYQIVGEKFELLANVIGEVPCLRIHSALLMNDLVQKSKFTVLTEDSLEIQQVLADPDKFAFSEYEYSEVCELPPCKKSIRGEKLPDISDCIMKDLTDKYIEHRNIGVSLNATRAYFIRRTGLSIPQINMLILKISKEVKTLVVYES